MRIDIIDPAARGVLVDPGIFEHWRVVDFFFLDTHCYNSRIGRGRINSPRYRYGFALACDTTARTTGGNDRGDHATVVIENNVLDFTDRFTLG